MKNASENNHDVILGSQVETPQTPTAKVQFEKLQRFFGKTYALALLAMLGTACTPEDGPGPEPKPVDPVVTTEYTAQTTITPNAITENAHGKIASVNTTVNKITYTDGIQTNTQAIDNATVSYTDLLNGQTVQNKDILLAEGFEADHENPDGSDKTDPSIPVSLTANITVDGKTITATDTNKSPVEDLADYTPLIGGKQLTDKNGNPALVEDPTTKKLYQKYKAIIAQYNPDNMEAINNGSVQKFIDASNGVFVGEVLADGNKYAKIVAGPHAGKYIDRNRAQETARYAMGEVLESPVDNTYLTAANTNLGALYSQLAAEAEAFTTHISSSTGQHFLTAKDNALLAAVAGILTAKELGEELLPAN